MITLTTPNIECCQEETLQSVNLYAGWPQILHSLELQLCFCSDERSPSSNLASDVWGLDCDGQMWMNRRKSPPSPAFHLRDTTVQQHKNMGHQNQMIMSPGSQYYKKPLSCFSHMNLNSCLEQLVLSRGEEGHKLQLHTQRCYLKSNSILPSTLELGQNKRGAVCCQDVTIWKANK